MKASAEFDIVVYGATGFTGQLVAEYLAEHYKDDASLKWAMAGRNLDRLKFVRQASGSPADTALIVTDASDRASLEAMINQTRLVISTVGPYQFYGSDLLGACAKTGTDYIDLCGEPIWMRQMIDAHDASAKASGARVLFSCGFDSLPFELGVFFCEANAREAWGLPASRVKARIRHATLSLSGGTYASTKASFVAASRDLGLVALLKDPFVLTPGFEGPKQPAGNKITFDEELNSWSAPFPMSTINTRNVHRSNMLMGFPYGKDFVYDEMISTGPGEQGRANAKLVMAATNKLSGSDAPKPGEGPSKEERESGSYDILFVALASDGRQLHTAVIGDCEPGYASTAKMITECAICLLRDAPDTAAGIWTPGAAMQQRLIKRLVEHAGLNFKIER
jgi:short subunit dehydrogenase-like uncharacterized protein